MFPMGCEKFQPFPNNEIYNVYGQCDEAAYTQLKSNPFIDGARNDNTVNCTITIVSSNSIFKSTGSFRIIGYGSRLFKKVSWGVKFFDKKFLGRKSVKIRALANDPTLIREKVTTELFKAVGVPVQEGTYARLFINGDTYGLYVLFDSLSERWFGSYIHGNPSAKIGVSYKLFSTPPTGPYSDFKYLGEDYTLYSDNHYYSIDEYEEDQYQPEDKKEMYQRLIEFIKMFDEWVKNYSDDTSEKAVEELGKFFNVEALLRLLVIETLTLAMDNFFLVMSNSAIYYNPDKNNYIIIPFDFDQTMGGIKDNTIINNDTALQDCITWVNYKDNEIFDHYFTNSLLKHPLIKERYNVILKKTISETFEADTVSEYVHALADLIREDVQWNFESIDQLNIPYDGYVNHFTYDQFQSNIDYGHVEYDKGNSVNDAPWGIKEWVEARGNACLAATKDVDISNNNNISDNEDVEVFKSGTSTSLTISFIMIAISQLILYFLL